MNSVRLDVFSSPPNLIMMIYVDIVLHGNLIWDHVTWKVKLCLSFAVEEVGFIIQMLTVGEDLIDVHYIFAKVYLGIGHFNRLWPVLCIKNIKFVMSIRASKIWKNRFKGSHHAFTSWDTMLGNIMRNDRNPFLCYKCTKSCYVDKFILMGLEISKYTLLLF